MHSAKSAIASVLEQLCRVGEYHVVFGWRPLPEYVERLSSVEHARSGEYDARARLVDDGTHHRAVERLDVRELEHVARDERPLYLLVRPAYEQLVVVVRLQQACALDIIK